MRDLSKEIEPLEPLGRLRWRLRRSGRRTSRPRADPRLLLPRVRVSLMPENGSVLALGNAHPMVLNASSKGRGFGRPLEHPKGIAYRELFHAYRPANQDDVANVLL